MTSTDTHPNTLAVIELAERDTPFCDCGDPMVPVALDHQIWLECASKRDSTGGRLRRFVAALALSRHTQRLVVDCA